MHRLVLQFPIVFIYFLYTKLQTYTQEEEEEEENNTVRYEDSQIEKRL